MFVLIHRLLLPTCIVEGGLALFCLCEDVVDEDQEYGVESYGRDDGEGADDGEDGEAPGGVLESFLAAEMSGAETDLHGSQDDGDVDEEGEQPVEVFAEERGVGVGLVGVVSQ